MSNLAKDNDILRMTDDCGEQSTLTVCSFFLVLPTLRVQNFVKRNVPEFWPHLRKFINAKKTEIYDLEKLIHAKKNQLIQLTKFLPPEKNSENCYYCFTS